MEKWTSTHLKIVVSTSRKVFGRLLHLVWFPDLYYQPHSYVRMEVYVAVNQPETCQMFIRFLLINIYSLILRGVSLFSFSFSYGGNKIGNFHVNHAMTCTLISTKKMAFQKLLIALFHYRTRVFSHWVKVNVKSKKFFDVSNFFLWSLPIVLWSFSLSLGVNGPQMSKSDAFIITETDVNNKSKVGFGSPGLSVTNLIIV